MMHLLLLIPLLATAGLAVRLLCHKRWLQAALIAANLAALFHLLRP